MKSLHVDFISLLKMAKKINRSKIELPTQNSTELLFRFSRLRTVELSHIKVSENINSKLELRMNSTCDAVVIIAPVSCCKNLNLDVIRNSLSFEVLLKFCVKF